MKSGLLIIPLMLLLWQPVISQKSFVGIGLQHGLPLGNLKETAGSVQMPGIHGLAMYNLPNSPIYAGLEAGYSIYGTELTKLESLMPGTRQNHRVRRNNNLLHLMGTLRLMPDWPTKIKPYAEVGAGALHAYTRSKIRENRTSEAISAGTEHFDWAFAYQTGLGIMTPVTPNTFLEIGIKYFQSQPLEYLTRRDAKYIGNEVYFHTRKSHFIMFQPVIRISGTF
ncbi:MAG: outer membrane beta-barrel protein [Cyclobacteriaceae bacterium]|nr:outer membrane beta-barrel protein [Cyclobacteriaceae bacterium]